MSAPMRCHPNGTRDFYVVKFPPLLSVFTIHTESDPSPKCFIYFVSNFSDNRHTMVAILPEHAILGEGRLCLAAVASDNRPLDYGV